MAKNYEKPDMDLIGQYVIVRGKIESGTGLLVATNISISEKEFSDSLEEAINRCILDHNYNPRYEGMLQVASFVQLSSGSEGLASPESDMKLIEKATVYGLAFHQVFRLEDDILVEEGGSHIPVVFTFSYDASNGFTLTEYWEPRDGSYYAKDLKAKFNGRPWPDTQKYLQQQMMDNYVQAIEYFEVGTDVLINTLLDTGHMLKVRMQKRLRNGLHIHVNYKIYVNHRDKNDYKLSSLSVQLGDGLGCAHNEMDYLRAQLCRTAEPTKEQITSLKEKAQTMLDQMGMGQWKVSSASVIKEMYGDTPEYQVLIGATPVFNNVHSIFGQPMMGLTSTDANASNYIMSSAVFQFSANGDLVYFDMTSPVEVQSVVNEGTAILPMEELMGKVKDHLSLTGAQKAYLFGVVESWYQKPLSCKIEMNRMEFGLARVKVANKDFTFYYVPAFVVYGPG